MEDQWDFLFLGLRSSQVFENTPGFVSGTLSRSVFPSIP
jgi:hypothetical protein